MNFVTLVMLACRIVNGDLYCSEPVSSRIEITIPKSRVEALEQQPYLFLPNIDMDTVVKSIYGTQKSAAKRPATMNGCKLTTDNGKEYHYEFSCKQLKKALRSSND